MKTLKRCAAIFCLLVLTACAPNNRMITYTNYAPANVPVSVDQPGE